MKRIFIILLVLAAICLLASFKVVRNFEDQTLKQSTPRLVNVVKKRGVALYSASPTNSKKVYTAPYSTKIPYKFSGKKGDWVYVYYDGRTLVIRDGGIETGNLLFNYWFVSSVDAKEHKISNIVFSVFVVDFLALVAILLAYFFSLLKPRVAATFRAASRGRAGLFRDHKKEQYLIGEVLRLKCECRNLSSEIENISSANAHLRGSVKALKSKNDALEKSLSASQNKNFKEQKRIKDKIESLDQIVESESKKREQGEASIAAMQSSYQCLQDKFQEVLSDAKTFDFPFEQDGYENILKGRLFELYMAKKVTSLGFNIYTWTPDKGFNAGLKVEANSNPDLVFIDESRNKFAVECKYRSKVGVNAEHSDMISWCAYHQYKAYERFMKEKDMPVYVAVGLSGPAASPHDVYFTTLQSIKSDSKYSEIDFKNKNNPK